MNNDQKYTEIRGSELSKISSQMSNTTAKTNTNQSAPGTIQQIASQKEVEYTKETAQNDEAMKKN